MNPRFLYGAAPFLILFITGCGSNPLPATKHTTKIKITVMQMPADKAPPANPRVLNLTAEKDIVEVMDWLHTIDWSQTGTDMAVIGIPAPDGGIEITKKDGSTINFAFYWDGKFVRSKENRLIRGGDTDAWKKIVERHVKN
jgi:hypothetical protein